MRRGAPVPALAALALVALLTGCGGGEGTSEISAAGPAQQTETAEAPQAPVAKQGQEQRGTAKGKAPSPARPLPNEGTKQVAPGVPTERGGDNSIQEYGTEGPSAERVQAARTLKGYLGALAAGETARACSHVADSAKRELRQTLEQLRARGREDAETPGCAEILRRLVAATPAKGLRDAARIRVRSMRTEGERAYLVYEDGGAAAKAIAMVEEEGTWRLATLTGTALPSGG